MKQTILSLSLLGTIVLTTTGCEVSDIISSGSDSVKLTKGDSEFKITLKGIDSDYAHVRYTLTNSSGSEVLSYGLNYKGTVTTTCNTSDGGSNATNYTCTTKYDTSAPMGDPKDKTKTITLGSGTNTIHMIESELLGDDKKTKIGTL